MAKFSYITSPTLIAVNIVQTTLKVFENYQGLGASIFAPIYNLEFYILHVSVPILSLFSLRLIFFSKTSDCKKRQMPSIQISEKVPFSNQISQHFSQKVKRDHVALAMKSCTCSLFTYWGLCTIFRLSFKCVYKRHPEKEYLISKCKFFAA